VDLGIFLLALVIAYLLPGPDMIVVLHMTASHGRKQAVAAAFGLGVARASHVVLAGLGLAALLQASVWAFDMVRYGGAVYLAWLGVTLLRLPSHSENLPPVGTERPEELSVGAAICRGLLTNILNPKALLFCSVLLPQFILPDAGGVAVQFLMLGAILVAVGFAFDMVFTVAGLALATFVVRHAWADRLRRWIFAAFLICFGLRLAWMT